MFRITPMVKNLLIINVAIFVLQNFLKLPLPEIFGLRVVFAERFAPYQFLAYMWLHADWGHLLSNMLAVFIFGPMLENVWGPKRFLTFYLICGIGAGVLFGIADFFEKRDLKQDMEAYIADPNPERFYIFMTDHTSNGYVLSIESFTDKYFEAPDNASLKNESILNVKAVYEVVSNSWMIGASGAVFGILMAFGLLFPNTVLYLLFPPIPVKAKYLVFFYGAYELYAEISRSAVDNVAHLAHLGGMVVAFILLRVWRENTNRFY